MVVNGVVSCGNGNMLLMFTLISKKREIFSSKAKLFWILNARIPNDETTYAYIKSLYEIMYETRLYIFIFISVGDDIWIIYRLLLYTNHF